MSSSEIRSLATGVSLEGRRIVGMIPYNSDSEVLSQNGRKFIERIAPGAFNRSLEQNDIAAYYSHNEDVRPPLGRTSAKTLRLSGNDEIGLRVWIDAPEWASDIVESVQRGDVRGLSFKFDNPDYQWARRGNMPVGTIRSANLQHVALVVNPAYSSSTASVRCLVEVPCDLIHIARLELQLTETELRNKKIELPC